MTANEKLREIELLAQKRKEEILNSPSEYPEGKRTFFVDDKNGKDTNDGLTPDTAWKTLEKVGCSDITEGDVVLFRRGGLWRGSLTLCDGACYSAYGEGEKPKIYGSIQAANADDWMETEIKNVWRYKPKVSYVKDVGAIIFDDGRLWGIKVCTNQSEGMRCDGTHDVFNGRTTFSRASVPFKDYRDLKNDLEFYHNPSDEQVYLYCEDGNPGEVFGSIELSIRRTILMRGVNVTVDNLCLKYVGIHGIGHKGQNVTFRNCEIGWIGGSSQFTENLHFRKNHPFNSQNVVRLGNGIEVYGGCDNYTIENCYIYQNYDCAVTAQYMGHRKADIIMNNIKWRNNLFDMNHYAFELWLSVRSAEEGVKVEMKNCDISGNLILNCGCGWSHQRPDEMSMALCSFTSKDNLCKVDNVCFHDNVFAGGRGAAFHAGVFLEGSEMDIKHNTIILHEGTYIAKHASLLFDGKFGNLIEATKENLALMQEAGYFKDNDLYLSDIKPTIKEAPIKV